MRLGFRQLGVVVALIVLTARGTGESSSRNTKSPRGSKPARGRDGRTTIGLALAAGSVPASGHAVVSKGVLVPTSDYQVIVLGGGAAGLGAARSAVSARARTLLVTEGPPGGDCTFTGCVPSKTLIEAADDGLGFDKALDRVRATVATIAATEDETALRGEGIDVVRGRARFTAPDRLLVDGTELTAPRVVIATGASPSVPPIDGLHDIGYLTTETVFDLTDAPESLVVLGGGAVGCELAQALARLGVRVSLVEADERILPGHDPDVATLLTDVFDAEGVTVHAGTQVTAADQQGGEVVLRTSGEAVSGQRLLVAVGRTPATRDLGLEAAGVDVDGHGFIIVDKHLATTAPGVFAAGDVTGLFGHTHAAYAMGRVAAGSALRRWPRPTFRTDAIPQVVFTDPEIATLGAQEHEVTDRRARIASLPLSEVDRAVTAEATTGFLKLIAGPRRLLGHTGGGRLLGATVVAQRAGELINELALAATTGMFTGRLAQTVHAYPTWSLAIQQTAAQFVGTHGGRTARPVSPHRED